ncbi:MAG: TfoX/Sxy family protein [Gemmatimonadetes bacterium]|nr:TfoX/Sxy family protein [Gemmatimonadota bacterium]
MAYDEALAERVRQALSPRRDVEEKRMFGGLAFMVASHMAVGVEKERLMVRLSPERAEACLEEAHVRPMDFTGRPLKGFVYVEAAGVQTTAGVRKWVARAVAHAESLPPKKPKKPKTVQKPKKPGRG